MTPTRGGKRPGAGRPRGQSKVPFYTLVNPEMLARVRKLCRASRTTISSATDQALTAWVQTRESPSEPR